MKAFIPLTGGCQCGAVRYEITAPAEGLKTCHCGACQKQSGSAFGMSLAVAPDTFRLLSGRLKAFDAIADSGAVKTCSFCPACGVRIHHTGPGWMVGKAGTLDDTTDLEPSRHIWASRKQTWFDLPADTVQLPEND